jgi:UDP-N-acetylglucosamine acyltransferase
VREYVTLNRGTAETGRTVIGNDCLFMANSHVGHDCRIGNKVIVANGSPIGGHVHMGDYVILGGLSPIHQFVHIGEHAMIGGGFRAVKDVPPFVLAGQEPLVFEGLNSVGLRRRGFSPKTLALLDQAYALLYRSNLNVSQALVRIKAEIELIPEIHSMIDFIEHSKRGIISGRSHR